MKRFWIGWLCLGLLLGLAGCGGNKKEPALTGARLGVGCVAACETKEKTEARLRATVAAVLLDADGRIAQCRLDELEFSAAADGKTPESPAALRSKGEAGADYLPGERETGGPSELKTSWREQAAAFAAFVKGKTAGEIAGLAATDGKASGVDGCDLLVTDFIEAIGKAAALAQKTAAAADGELLTLAILAERGSASASDTLQYDLELAAVTRRESTVTGCFTDTLSVKLTVENGRLVAPSGALQTKRAMGDGYGMKAASALKKEWHEQAAAFDRDCEGKTVATIQNAVPAGDGKLDGISGCTVEVSGLWKAVLKAAEKEN